MSASSGTVLFATSAELPGLTDDDRLAADALRRLGFDVRPLVWSDPGVPDARAVVVRSCWDYHLQPDAFVAWIDRLAAAGATVLNPPAMLRHNLHKRYLLGLARDVALPPTELVPRGSSATLGQLAARLGGERLVIKPAISLSAFGTWRTDAPDDATEARFAAQLAGSDLLVQRFVPEVTDGELSLVYFAGRYSHCVRKIPAPGDFRVQADFGGTRQPWRPDAGTLAAADRVVARHAADAVYARVDGIVTAAGFVLMELELIDPVLFFAYAPGSAETFAAALASRLG